jgi:hypothetical protein
MSGEAAGSEPRWNTAYPTDDFRNFLHPLYTNARLSFQIAYSVLSKLHIPSHDCVKIVSLHPIKAYGGNGGVAPLILNLGTRWM